MTAKELHGYGAVIKCCRNNAGMSQAELANALSVKRAAIVNWELERIQPDIRSLQVLCDKLNIPPSKLRRISFTGTYAEREKHLIACFRSLSSEGKTLAEKQTHSIQEMENSRRYNWKKGLYHVGERYYKTKSAIGSGNLFTDECPKIQLIRNTPMNAKADAIMTVDVRGMEPIYHSGDLVYVQYTNGAVIRPCLIIGKMTNGGDFFVRRSRFSTGVLDVRQGKSAKHGRKSSASGRFDNFQARPKCVNENRQLYSLNDKFPFGEKRFLPMR